MIRDNCNKAGVWLSAFIRTRFPIGSDARNFIIFVFIASGLFVYSVVHYSIQWYDARQNPVVRVRTELSNTFLPAFRVCMSTDVGKQVDIASYMYAYNDKTYSEQQSEVYIEFNNNPELEQRAGGPLAVYNLMQSAAGLPTLNSTQANLHYLYRSQFHLKLTIGDRIYDCAFLNTRGELYLQRESARKEMSMIVNAFFDPAATVDVVAYQPALDVSVFPAFPLEATDTEIMEKIFDVAWNRRFEDDIQSLYVGAAFAMSIEETKRYSIHDGEVVTLHMTPVFQSILATLENVRNATRTAWYNTSNDQFVVASTRLAVRPKSYFITVFSDEQAYDFGAWVASLGGIVGLLTTAYAILFPPIRSDAHECRISKMVCRRSRHQLDWDSQFSQSNNGKAPVFSSSPEPSKHTIKNSDDPLSVYDMHRVAPPTANTEVEMS